MLVPKTYNLIERCVEDGISWGWQRAHKHTDNPTEQSIKDAINVAIMHEICEWFDIVIQGEDDEY